jgi:hypothetical protein
MKRLSLYLALLLLATALTGCGLLGDNKDPKTPDGAWNLFVENMKNKNYDAAWNLLSDESKQDFEYVFTLITTLFSNLPPDEKKQMDDIFRQELGDIQIAKPTDLLRAEFGEIDESVLAGSKIDTKVISGNECTITTKAAQTFTMIKKGDNWYLNYDSIKEAQKDFEAALTQFGIALPPKLGTAPAPAATAPKTPAPAAPSAMTTPAPTTSPAGKTPTPAGPKSPAPKPPPPIKAGKHK